MVHMVCRMQPAPLSRCHAVRPASRRRTVVLAANAVEIPSTYTKIQPTGDLVLVKVARAEEKTAGGIILPDSAQKRPTSGDVVGVGEGNTVTGKKEMTLKEGDTVLYGRFGIGCTDLKMGDGDYVLIREDDIIGKMPRPGASASDIPEMTPMGTRVLVRVTEESSVTVGGVLLPDAAKEKPVMGEVHAVGPGTKEDAMELKVGDRVVYFKYAGDPMETPDGKKWVVLRQDDILCKA